MNDGGRVVWEEACTHSHDRGNGKGFGFRVRVQFKMGSVFRGASETLRNVTEIHMGYRPGRIAFESDIHGTGHTYNVADIAEYEALPETNVALNM